jgi:hypothetical protein
MSKLQTMRNNITRFHYQRQMKALQQLKDIFSPPPKATDTYVEQIMAPPQELIQLYFSELAVYVNEHIAGDATFTREQVRTMIEDHLMNCWRRHQAGDNVLGMVNRQTYWKPRVELKAGWDLVVYLGNTIITTIN